LRDEADHAADELRAIVEALVPPALIELGLAGAVGELAESMPIPTRVDVAVPGRLADTTETTAYLVVAEALSNVVKHSRATFATVSLRTDGSWLHVTVTDNGMGITAPATGSQHAGTGLAGIADRVAAVGGTSAAQTPPEGGTKIWARIPYES
jgi:signal transduction histidine kinase